MKQHSISMLIVQQMGFIVHTLLKSVDKKQCFPRLNRALSKVRLKINLPDGSKIAIRPLVRGDTEALDEIYVQQVYTDLEKDIRGDEIVVDAGAHIGIFTLKIYKRLERWGKIIAIEPHPGNYQLLLTNIALNRCKNVVPRNTALSDVEEHTKLYVSPDTSAHSLTSDESAQWLIARCERLDSILAKLIFSNKDRILIKMDIEGSELKALDGAKSVLQSSDVKLLIECHSDVNEVKRICGYLLDRGFKSKLIVYVGMPYIYASRSKVPG